MNNTNKEEFKVGLKKSISAANQALELNYALEGLSAQDYTTADDLVEGLFKKRMNTIDGKESFTTDDCNGAVFTTADGVIYCVGQNYLSDNSDAEDSICNYSNTTPCSSDNNPNLWIDVNGEKKPNTLTVSSEGIKDVYQAQIYAQKIIPYGEASQSIMYEERMGSGGNGSGSGSGSGSGNGSSGSSSGSGSGSGSSGSGSGSSSGGNGSGSGGNGSGSGSGSDSGNGSSGRGHDGSNESHSSG